MIQMCFLPHFLCEHAFLWGHTVLKIIFMMPRWAPWASTTLCPCYLQRFCHTQLMPKVKTCKNMIQNVFVAPFCMWKCILWGQNGLKIIFMMPRWPPWASTTLQPHCPCYLKRRKKICRAKKSGPPIKNEQAKRLRQKYAEQKSPNQWKMSECLRQKMCRAKKSGPV